MQPPLVNLARTKYLTSISCGNTPTRDGHDVWNLVVDSPPSGGGLTKPFTVEHFVKPPIEIKLSFRTLVALYAITLQPRVGQSCIQQLTVTIETEHTNRYSRPRPYGRPTVSHGQRSRNPPHLYAKPTTVSLGTLTIPRPQASGFKYQPYGLCCRSVISHVHQVDAIQSYFGSLPSAIEWTNFVREPPQELNNVRTVTLRISRVHNASLVALQSLQVWGIAPEHRVNLSSSPSPSVPMATGKPPPNTFHELLEPPTDFIDPITCDTMVDPVILPSHNVCDRSTVQRYFDAAQQCRDPFTGLAIAWSDLCADTALQNRIAAWQDHSQTKAEP
ncbi:RING finger protein 37 [Dimargaris verticillata]|uniref:RING finger protein 37 n=1 Tax=Dimargaris verticillata TaxID=2761393 RepID=A0A9W8B276_9FUNG|nr:RING finger protein 37 [Dimargaris verticillata]